MAVDPRVSPQTVREPAFLLRVMQGPDRRKQKRVATPRLLIGSGLGAEFHLSDPTVSAIHCEISSEPSGFWVRDLGAKNGVRFGRRVVREARLEERDEFALGQTLLSFQALTEAGERQVEGRPSYGRLVGSSLPMRLLYEQLDRAGAGDSTVLLWGETGTGKELAAEAIIARGLRRDRPVVVVDCASISPELAESELFGHERGAFTGATGAVAGPFERADTGTLLLDEVGELPLELQAKLLAVLERKRVQRVGGRAPVAVDVRVIASTHRELEREVNRGAFRADLFYRLAVIQIRLPPLRDRRDDIPALVERFLDELPGASALPAETLARLVQRDYPGNVRELRNALARAAAGLETSSGPAAPPEVDLDGPFRDQKEKLIASFERTYFERLLDRCKGNVTEAARRSGLSRVQLHEIIRKRGVRSQRPRDVGGG